MTTLPTDDRVRAWLPMRSQDVAGDAVLLFCLPHAGGGASAFRGWVGTHREVDVVPVQPPGREARMREPAFERMDPLVDELVSVIERSAAGQPFALYGHSLGALVAYETAVEMRRRRMPAPVHLIVSGAPAAHRAKEGGRAVSTMATPRLVSMLRKLGGTPEWVLQDPEMLAMVLPVIRADFALRESYRYRREPPLEVPVTVIATHDDARASFSQQARWTDRSTRPGQVHTLTGGHFAIFEETERVTRLVRDALVPTAGGRL
ncbi:thioesterase II family protein [Nocardioides sp. GXZ039]|uniref:thioesterase II family protein n=1 Tax=Nocardioides sp. GXZ039 TaxID=3136018 RepID=UPI0030F3D911